MENHDVLVQYTKAVENKGDARGLTLQRYVEKSAKHKTNEKLKDHISLLGTSACSRYNTLVEGGAKTAFSSFLLAKCADKSDTLSSAAYKKATTDKERSDVLVDWINSAVAMSKNGPSAEKSNTTVNVARTENTTAAQTDAPTSLSSVIRSYLSDAFSAPVGVSGGVTFLAFGGVNPAASANVAAAPAPKAEAVSNQPKASSKRAERREKEAQESVAPKKVALAEKTDEEVVQVPPSDTVVASVSPKARTSNVIVQPAAKQVPRASVDVITRTPQQPAKDVVVQPKTNVDTPAISRAKTRSAKAEDVVVQPKTYADVVVQPKPSAATNSPVTRAKCRASVTEDIVVQPKAKAATSDVIAQAKCRAKTAEDSAKDVGTSSPKEVDSLSRKGAIAQAKSATPALLVGLQKDTCGAPQDVVPKTTPKTARQTAKVNARASSKEDKKLNSHIAAIRSGDGKSIPRSDLERLYAYARDSKDESVASAKADIADLLHAGLPGASPSTIKTAMAMAKDSGVQSLPKQERRMISDTFQRGTSELHAKLAEIGPAYHFCKAKKDEFRKTVDQDTVMVASDLLGQLKNNAEKTYLFGHNEINALRHIWNTQESEKTIANFMSRFETTDEAARKLTKSAPVTVGNAKVYVSSVQKDSVSLFKMWANDCKCSGKDSVFLAPSDDLLVGNGMNVAFKSLSDNEKKDFIMAHLVSRDALLVEKIKEIAKGKAPWISNFSVGPEQKDAFAGIRTTIAHDNKTNCAYIPIGFVCN